MSLPGTGLLHPHGLRRQRGGDVGAAAAPLHGVGGTGGPGGGRARRCRFEAGKNGALSRGSKGFREFKDDLMVIYCD